MAERRRPEGREGAQGNASLKGSSGRSASGRNVSKKSASNTSTAGRKSTTGNTARNNSGNNSGNNGKSNTRKKKAKKKSRAWIFVLEIFVLLIMAAVLYLVNKMDKIQKVDIPEDNIFISDEVAGLETIKGFKNVALFGVDSRDGKLGKGARTDTIMIASLNEDTGEAKLVSVYRDTYLNLANDTYNKANLAYAKGGPEQAINMLNMCMDLNITDYVTIDFRALTETIDALGGIPIEVTSEEISHLNNYQIGTQEVTGGDIVKVTEPGLQTLNGLQATSYCRIRYTAGDDYKRTERQRIVLQEVAKKASKANVGALNGIVNAVFDKIATSFSSAEMIGYLSKATSYSIGETAGFPFEKKSGTIGKKGSCVVPVDLSANVVQLHQFLFGDSEVYTPSATVKNIAVQIKDDTSKYIK